jgi:type III secretion protein F
MSIGLNDSMGSIVNDGISFVQNGANDLKAKMADIRSGNVEDQATAMIELQFSLGQYNMFVEATSNISKSITDTAKSLAQKVS